MGGHDAKIGQAEIEFIFCVLEGNKHYFTPQIVFKNPNFVICPAGYMVESSGNKFSFLSHKQNSLLIYSAKYAFCLIGYGQKFNFFILFMRKGVTYAIGSVGKGLGTLEKSGAWHLCVAGLYLGINLQSPNSIGDQLMMLNNGKIIKPNE